MTLQKNDRESKEIYPFSGFPSEIQIFLKNLFDMWEANKQEYDFEFSIDSFDNITKIFLFGNHSSPIPGIEDEIQKITNLFPKLEILEIEYDFLNKIPLDLSNLPNLRILCIGGKRLSQLPIGLGLNSRNLQKFCISSSNITHLPQDLMYLPSLTYLGIKLSPKFSQLPDNIDQLHTLEEIELEYTAITHIPDSLLNIPSLKKISLVQDEKLQYIHPKLREITYLVN
ncbi:hypothetical protein NEF87_002688 [Candidatus Lokiarchaeum ossiferum]|uniref:Leucine-rich repeat domain-containing protein n=1 Tax=Candidatus Lokiarchaeum ossiferum TaxID=2951803 RepID=A0ABY6HSB7_9ARCH|nr:hypothetical protein NEF87_002688 [Candidatus Lokiarchaeum sp. B-35]